ncbi:DNA (cytosine-5-)-methyltransferase [Carnobacterium inhibens]|uniref:Cytosine-specific methyltransferase n=1 Tax=Carnobacterium inhibens subsp. gilichinskyi TaxID=1266845 RepID=U5SBM8_9LACT|nr:DNA (cytosine-5-)-methyltransferase [Carnobacterium inhibens]AGY82630.1 5-methylcytosine methyltransferase [Carnobacterium inhibens subsp. gilichinskyi]
MSKQFNILELFAGVGGFRVGFENSNESMFKTKWANQWEPAKKSQDAFEVYDYHYPDSMNINENIEEISDEAFQSMDADIIVGGFPCQDYSVARSKKNELGIQGKKGVLFWEIIRAVTQIKPKYLVLENVDRLLKAPSKQRGRDFAIMLAAFNDLNYSVEWRVINAANYGGSQRRRRVFFFVYRNDTDFAKKIDKEFENKELDLTFDSQLYDDYIFTKGLFARQFPIVPLAVKNRHATYTLSNDIVDISDNFIGTVWNTGIMRHGRYFTIDTVPTMEENPVALGEILVSEEEVSEKYFITDQMKLEKFKYLRGSKKIERTSVEGHTYIYSEGSMAPTDNLSLPGRTMLTSEGTVNRSTHFLNVNGKYRLITPIEAERLQEFPDDWTKYKKTSTGEIVEVPDRMRMFFMGNALVTGIVKRIADELQNIIDYEV